MNSRTKKITIGSLAVAAVVAAAAGAVGASGIVDTDEPITGDALETASRVALEHTGGGQVTETEVGDEDSYYEVEVLRPDGQSVDVQLDEDFNVVGASVDVEDDADDVD